MGVSSALCVCRQRIVVQAYACGALHTKVDDFASGARFMCVFSAISFNCGSTYRFLLCDNCHYIRRLQSLSSGKCTRYFVDRYQLTAVHLQTQDTPILISSLCLSPLLVP